MENIQKQIDDLKKQIEDLKNLIDYSFVESMKDRFFENRGVSSTQTITTPAEGETFTAPAQPTGTITLIYKGKRYKLLYE